MKDLSQCTILLVDDTKSDMDILVRALGKHFHLRVAANGRTAIELVRRQTPDLILLDIMMPEMDGFETCRRIKEIKSARGIPIIFITAMDHPKNITQGFSLGAVDYVTKPFNITEVRSRVKTHLTLKLTQDAMRRQNIVLEEIVSERTRELEETQNEIITRLGLAAEFRDEETGRHIRRMSRFCELIGRAIGLPEKETVLLGRAATMHDVGKIGIPDTILLKPGLLNEKENEIMKSHTDIGAALLSGSTSRLLQIAEIIARTHHEKWDGSGYNQGLAGEDIPLYGRIACICDALDALISKRPYKDAWPLEMALMEITNRRGTHFDPHLVDVLIELKKDVIQIIECVDWEPLAN